QPEFRAQPEIAVAGLGYRRDLAFGEALAHPPSGVRILTDVKFGIQGEGARCQQHDGQSETQRAEWSHGGYILAHLVRVFGTAPARVMNGDSLVFVQAVLGNNNVTTKGRAALRRMCALPKGETALCARERAANRI